MPRSLAGCAAEMAGDRGYEGTVEPGFEGVASAFARFYGAPTGGGGALSVRWRGRAMVDVWTGLTDEEGSAPWQRDTLSISFSTTKGVAATVLHRLHDRGLIDYDAPVAEYWPAFAAAGKERITVRRVLCHEAGLYSIRAIATQADELLDHELMEERLAARPADGWPGPSYHGITFGWLISGICRGVTGKGMGELVRTELAEPLGTDGLHLGLPEGHGRVVATLLGQERIFGLLERVVHPLERRSAGVARFAEAFDVPGFVDLFTGPAAKVHAAEMPAVSGAFTADALALLYGALAEGGVSGSTQLLSAATTRELAEVQTRQRDGVIGYPMHWRLGYHRGIGLDRPAPEAFGHHGYAGSGGWADPVSGLSVGYVTNRRSRMTTPFGDLALIAIGRRALAAAKRSG